MEPKPRRRRASEVATPYASAPSTKDERIALRLTPDQRRLLDEAAKVERTTLSAFVLDAATLHAQQVLADRVQFVLEQPEWDAFVAMLDRPARDRPDLRALLSRPSVFADPEPEPDAKASPSAFTDDRD